MQMAYFVELSFLSFMDFGMKKLYLWQIYYLQYYLIRVLSVYILHTNSSSLPCFENATEGKNDYIVKF